jgi:glycosyltransferase involved in cell wall biosynthesis
MKITILSHNVSSNAVMRAHRLACAAQTFADVELIGPVERKEPWPALPQEPWIRTVREKRFPKFFSPFVKLVNAADGDVLLAVKPHFASFGAALVASERRQVPVILDLDDLDVALAPRSQWASHPTMAELERPRSPIYVALFTRAAPMASAITVASTALQRQFGGTLIPHGCCCELFDPNRIDREQCRRTFGFTGPTVLFPGTPRSHKGISVLADAVRRIPGAGLAVSCRDSDLTEPEWQNLKLHRVPVVSYAAVPQLYAAADVVVIPQLDSEPARYQTPMKVFDAMAMAKPIVASAVSDLPEILNGCGRLVPPDDIDQLTAAISRLLSDSAEARNLGERARSRCLEHYSIQQIGAKLRKVVGGLNNGTC